MAKTTEQLIIELVLKVDKAVAGFNGLSQGTEKYNQQLLKTISLMNQLSTSSGKGFPQIANMSVGNNPALLKEITDTKNAISSGLVPAVEKIPPATKNAAQGFNILRSAMGFLVAMGMSAIMQNISKFFTDALTLATKFRGQMAELNFAEAVLSKKGMDITRKELDGFVKDIETKYKYISKFDATGIVSTVADMGAEFNLTKEKILGLSDAVTFITLRERAYGMEVSDTGSIVNAALDGRSNYFNKLGINITKTAIKEKAYTMGLAENGAEISKEISNQAAIALLIEQTAGKYDELIASIEKTNPALANQLIISKELQEAQGKVGEAVLGLKDAWNGLLVTLIENGTLKLLVDDLIVVIGAVATLIRITSELQKVSDGTWEKLPVSMQRVVTMLGLMYAPALVLGKLLLQIPKAIFAIEGAFIGAIKAAMTFFQLLKDGEGFSEAGRQAAERFVANWEAGLKLGENPLLLFGGNNTTTETPTAPTIPAPTVDQNLLDAVAKFNQEILDAELKLGQDLEDAAIDYERKRYDIAVEYAAKRADLEKDYANKIADINRAYADKIAEINQRQREERERQRNDELQREREFQNQMLVLKENFLLALDDALHNKDARQILKLMKSYELDKKQAERKHELEEQAAQEDAAIRNRAFNEDRRRAEAERRAKLAEAQQDYADKLAKLEADEKAELEAARLANERKIEDLKRANQDRLEIIAAGLVEEYKLTEDNLKGIVALYLRYYNNATAILAAMRAQLAGTMAMMNQVQNAASGMSGTGGTGSGTGGSGSQNGIPMAQGGTIIANRPTTVTFGERGLEAGTFMPLNRVGKNVNSLFSNVSNAGGEGGGKVSIELLLSPDLESRIVSNTLNRTAEVFTKVQRTAKR